MRLAGFRNVFLVACICALLTSSCIARQPIKIGVIIPLTGTGSDFGIGALNGFNLALEEINSGKKVLGRELRIIVRDDENNSTKSNEAALNLIYEEGVVAITGVPFSKIALNVAPLCQSAGVPVLSSVATNVELTKIGDCVFRACFNNDFEAYAAALFAINALQMKTCGVIFEVSSPFASDLAKHFKQHFEDLGGKVTSFEPHPAETKDFSTQLEHILKTKPEFIFCPDLYEDSARIIIQARKLGFDKPIIGGDGWDSNEFIRIGGSAVESTYYVTHFAKDDPDQKVQDFVKAYTSKYATEPNVESVLCYDSLMLIAEALRKAGSPGRKKLKEALRKMEYDGVTGKIVFENSGEPKKAATVIKIENGKQKFFTRIYPP